MTESQSRYGIMEELNSKKLAEKKALADLEEKKQTQEAGFQDKIDEMANELATREGSYKREHEQWKVKRKAEIGIKTTEFKREVSDIEEDIKLREENYEYDFQRWKAVQASNIEAFKKNLTIFSKQQERAISAKKDLIKEIDAGMANLKEMSKEQKEK